jgi:hypothetical protein
MRGLSIEVMDSPEVAVKIPQNSLLAFSVLSANSAIKRPKSAKVLKKSLPKEAQL